MLTLGAIFMLYILLCCVNGSAQPDETANWLDQRSGIAGREKPHRFYGKCCVSMKTFCAVLLFATHIDLLFLCFCFSIQ